MHTKQELYIIRHGETDYNNQRIIQGRGVNTSLNQTGRQQALAFFHAYRHFRFDYLISSSLKRAIQTLEPFAGDGHEIATYSELDEIDWGHYEGLVPDGQMKAFYKEVLTEWKNGNLRAKIENGESPVELRERQQRFIDNELASLSGRILICMHGRSMRSFLCTLLKQELHLMDAYPHQNVSLYKLSGKPGNYQIDLFNSTIHLEDNSEVVAD